MRRQPPCSKSTRISRSFRARRWRSCQFCRFPPADRPRCPLASFSRKNDHAQHRTPASRPGNQSGESLSRVLPTDASASLPPDGFACTVHHLEPHAGGTFKMSFRNFTTGASHHFGGEYVELVPGERLRYTDKFDDPNLPGLIEVTVTLKKVLVGTELDIVQAGLLDSVVRPAGLLPWLACTAKPGKAGGAGNQPVAQRMRVDLLHRCGRGRAGQTRPRRAAARRRSRRPRPSSRR